MNGRAITGCRMSKPVNCTFELKECHFLSTSATARLVCVGEEQALINTTEHKVKLALCNGALERLENDAVHLNGWAAFCICAGAERSSVPLVDKEGDGCRCRMQRGTNITGSLLRMCQTRMIITPFCKLLN